MALEETKMSHHRVFNILKETGFGWAVHETPAWFGSILIVKTSEELTDDIKKRIEGSIGVLYTSHPEFNIIFQVGGK